MPQTSSPGPSTRAAPAPAQEPTPETLATAIPPDASSLLTTISAAAPDRSLRRTLAAYLSLAKPRLTFLVVLTTAAAYSMHPVPALLLSTSSSVAPALSGVTLAFLASGTALTSACANALNMAMEPRFDAQMTRTRNRPIVRGLVSRTGAVGFAAVTGALGTGALYAGVDPVVAALGAGCALLYAGVYTPLKRVHPINTWVGAVVGAIPPLMGWAAAAAQIGTLRAGDSLLPLMGPDAVGGWALAALLFFWQIPHFAALSWPIRGEYAAAGYRMLVSSNPRLDAWLSLGCALALPACVAELWAAEVIETWAFVAMMPANIWIGWRSWGMVAKAGAKGSARSLFWASVWYLPVVLVLGMVGKKGLSDRLWDWLTGEGDDDEFEFDEVVSSKPTA
jgi:protoheme IX farnesyltransferase